jgi:two-component system NarL family response regulator
MSDRSTRIRVLCVDDHQLVLDGLALIIGSQPDLEVVASCRRGDEALALFRLHHPDVTLMDLQLPGMSGLEAIRAIRAEYPDARIIVVTMYQGDEDIFRALQAGATMYLLKDTLSSELVSVIREVHNGLRPIQPGIEARLAERSEHRALTAREVDVLELVSQGLRNKEIATRLDLSEATVQVHVKNILAKFNVNDRTAAISVALRRGIIHI